jgi:hypothetical protein
MENTQNKSLCLNTLIINIAVEKHTTQPSQNMESLAKLSLKISVAQTNN